VSDQQISFQSQLISVKNYSRYPEQRIFRFINLEILSFLYKSISITTDYISQIRFLEYYFGYPCINSTYHIATCSRTSGTRISLGRRSKVCKGYSIFGMLELIVY
jgi:hypothetical protein